MLWFEILKATVLGIIQGITEWLPISSTGHMILADEFFPLGLGEDFKNMFLVVVQFGSILAVLALYFHKLNPFSPRKNAQEKKDTFLLWSKVLVGVIPAAVIGLLFEDLIDTYLYNPYTVATTLIVYGILFLVLESRNKKPQITEFSQLSYKTAFLIGAFQVLALIPGTSRSGSTILGAMSLGTSRSIAAEYSFFLAVPVMLGASGLKLLKFGAMTSPQLVVLLVGMVVAFLVSIVAIKFLMRFIQKHDFKAFGYYRIVLGVLVVLYFALLG